MLTPHETAIQVLKEDLRTCRRYAQDLLTEKNILSRQIEILTDDMKMSEEDKSRLRQKAINEA